MFLKKLGRLVLVTMSSFMLLLITTAPAHAAEKDESLPAEAELQPSPKGGVTTQVLPGNPYYCFGKTPNPHVSEHNPGNAVTIVRTDCNQQATSQYAYGEMYRDRWYGLQFLDDAGSSYFYTYGKVRAIPTFFCNGQGIYTYKTWSDHRVTISGTQYGASTYNDNRFAC